MMSFPDNVAVRALTRFAEAGTAPYPRAVRRRLAIVNLMALLIAAFSAVYALVFTIYGPALYAPLIVANLLLVAVALLIPLAHRINDVAAALLLALAEFVALFFFVWALGRDSGIQINYIIAAAVAFTACRICASCSPSARSRSRCMSRRGSCSRPSAR